MKIALCAGHYKKNPGARNKKHDIYENQVSSPIVEILKDLLDEHEVTIISGTLRHKVSEINKGHYDLALDIHFNADPELEDTDNKQGYGCEVMYYPHSAKRKSQAAKFSSAMASRLETKDRGAKPAWYWGGDKPGTKPDYYTEATNCPAFIPEPGFIDNNKFTEDYLLDDHGLVSVAEAIKAGIETFE